MPQKTPRLVLASTSPYRREQLAKLGLHFETGAPAVDEDDYKKKISHPIELAQTLARLKALSLSAPDACVIGGDQLVSFEGNILGKPKTPEKAFAQLKMMQGKPHLLITALHVISGSAEKAILNQTTLQMRALTDQQIQNYLELDQPWDCAGSYKIEKSGLVLMESIDTKDFSAIQGLPLLELTQTLAEMGFVIPGKLCQ